MKGKTDEIRDLRRDGGNRTGALPVDVGRDDLVGGHTERFSRVNNSDIIEASSIRRKARLYSVEIIVQVRVDTLADVSPVSIVAQYIRA